jgi:hypothetical protein
MSMLEVLCKRMPLSSMVRGLFERCFSADRLNGLFAREAKEQYTRNILFSTLCEVMLQVVLRVHPSAHAAYQAQEAEMDFSKASLYDKLKGIENQVCVALLRETAQDLTEVQDALGITPAGLLPGYRVRILDGNCLAASEKRLRVHRGVSGAALPGKSLVVMDPERRLLIDVFPCEDGHAQERSLLDQVIPSIKAGELWIADRNFCTCGFIAGVVQQDAYLLFRQHGQLPFQAMSAWSAPVMNGEGQTISEQRITIEGKQYRRIRIALTAPTRDGDACIDLVTNVPPAVDAVTLAGLYRKRWRLETAFQHLEAHLASEIQTLAYPRAALFAFCLALVAYNVFSMSLSAIDAVHSETVSDTMSTYYIGQEIASTFLALFLLTAQHEWAFLHSCSSNEFAQWLRQVASNVRVKKYKKHSRGPKKPPQKIPYDSKQPHVSTKKLLQNAALAKTGAVDTP